MGGTGGSSFFGGAGIGGQNTPPYDLGGQGQAGAYGGGGGGADGANGTSNLGGAGGNGIVWVLEFA
jgi:hypothetical protein